MVSLFGVGDFDPVIPSNVGLRSRQKTEESWCRWKGLEGTVDQSKGGVWPGEPESSLEGLQRHTGLGTVLRPVTL